MATRYFVSGGDGNWGSTNNWSTTSGGAGGSSVPTSSDDVIFDANSPSCMINTTNRSCLTLVCTNYTQTLTMTFQLTVAGSVTLGSAMTIAGTATLVVSAIAATLTSNGKTWGTPLTVTGGASRVYTLADNWTVASLIYGSSGAVTTVNGMQFNVLGSCTISTTTGSYIGTNEVILSGSGTLESSLTTGRFGCSLTLSGGYTLTGNLRYGGGTLKHTGGVFTIGSNTLTLTGATSTIDLATLPWPTVSFEGSFTYTLTTDLYVTSSLALGSTTGATVINGSRVIFTGSTIGSAITTGSVTGSAVLRIQSACTVSSATMTIGRIAIPHTIDAHGHTVTISATWNSDICKWSVYAGNVVAANTWVTTGTNEAVLTALSQVGYELRQSSKRIQPSVSPRLEFFVETSNGAPVASLTRTDVSAAAYRLITAGLRSGTTSVSLTSDASQTDAVSAGQFVTISSTRGHYAIDCPAGAALATADQSMASITMVNAAYSARVIVHDIDNAVSDVMDALEAGVELDSATAVKIDAIKAKTDTIGTVAGATTLLAAAVLEPGTITSFPEVLTIGNSYTVQNGRSINLPVVDTDGNPLSDTGSLSFADASVTFTIQRAGETNSARVITGSASFVDPPGTGTGAGAPYAVIELPASETAKGLAKYKYSGILTFTWTGTGTDVMSFETDTITFDN